MKKFAVAAVAALALAGCSSGSTDTAATPSSTPSMGLLAVEVDNAYILPNGEVAGMFGQVRNTSTEAVKLTGGSAEGVGMVQVHEYIKEGTKEVMKEVPGGLEIPAGGTVELKPGSYHVMMMDVTADWKVGDQVTVTLDFSDGEKVPVQAEVKQREGMQ